MKWYYISLLEVEILDWEFPFISFIHGNFTTRNKEEKQVETKKIVWLSIPMFLIIKVAQGGQQSPSAHLWMRNNLHLSCWGHWWKCPKIGNEPWRRIRLLCLVVAHFISRNWVHWEFIRLLLYGMLYPRNNFSLEMEVSPQWASQPWIQSKSR